jgi:xylan 1,4-beta-xylosidase
MSLLLLLLWSIAVLAARQQWFQNPVKPFDLPDPSIIRVGASTFFATATTSEWLAAFPILTSTDLVNWRIVTSVFPSAPPAWAEGSFWAPELHHDTANGTATPFIVFYTARKRNGPLCVAAATAASPTGPWLDRGPLVCQADGSIDPCAIRDENGDMVLVWKEDGNSQGRPTTIWAQRLDLATWTVVGNATALFANDPASWEGGVVEAPFVMRRHGFFYLFFAANGCCGRGCSYAMGVARSASVWGAWTKLATPLLATNEHFACPGHGTVVTLADDRTFVLYHAFSAGDGFYLGRQMMLDEVRWPANFSAWPSINGGRGPSANAIAPLGVATNRTADDHEVDEFNGVALAPGWIWPNGIAPPRVKVASGVLSLAPDASRAADPQGAVLGHYVPSTDWTVQAIVRAQSLANGTLIAATACGAPDAMIGVGVLSSQVVLFVRNQQQFQTLRSVPLVAVAPEVWLELSALHGAFFSFAFSIDGDNFQSLWGAPINGDWLNQWDRGIRFCLTVGGQMGAVGQFERFQLDTLSN